MKCFTITQEKVSPGISITIDPYPHIGVGEQGRGRRYSRFPIARDFANTFIASIPCGNRGKSLFYKAGYETACQKCGQQISIVEGKRIHPELGYIATSTGEHINHASVIKTRASGTLLLIPEADQKDQRVLVLVKIEAGYRGGTAWSGVEKSFVPCPHRNDIIPGNLYFARTCSFCGEIAKKNGEEWVHPDCGGKVKYESFPTPGIKILAEGTCAQGAAGRMGGHAVKLLTMEPNARFEVVRSGRLYSAPPERIIFYDGKNIRIGTHNEIFPPSSLSEAGEAI